MVANPSIREGAVTAAKNEETTSMAQLPYTYNHRECVSFCRPMRFTLFWGWW
jgi:hypothetical protein